MSNKEAIISEAYTLKNEAPMSKSPMLANRASRKVILTKHKSESKVKAKKGGPILSQGPFSIHVLVRKKAA